MTKEGTGLESTVSTEKTGPATVTDMQDKYWEYKFNVGYEMHYVFGTVNLWLGLQAMAMNMLVIAFYAKKRKKVVPFMYLLIATVDFFTGISALCSGILFYLAVTHLKAALYLFYPIYSIFSITTKISVFLNVSIAIIRTINIYAPFYHINVTYVTISTALYSIFWVIWTAADIGKDMNFRPSMHLLGERLVKPGGYQVSNMLYLCVTRCRNDNYYMIN